jgi:hypothetical protein
MVLLRGRRTDRVRERIDESVSVVLPVGLEVNADLVERHPGNRTGGATLD